MAGVVGRVESGQREQGQAAGARSGAEGPRDGGHLVAGRVLGAAERHRVRRGRRERRGGCTATPFSSARRTRWWLRPGSRRLARLMTTVLGSTSSLKVAVTVVLVVATPVAPGAGWRSITVGFVVSAALVVEYDVDPVVGRLVAAVGESARRAVAVDAVAAIDPVLQGGQRGVDHPGVREVPIVGGVVPVGSEVRRHIGGAGGDRHRRCEVRLLPATGGLVAERHGGEPGPGAVPQRPGVGASVAAALVEADSRDEPVWSDRNFMPSSTADESGSEATDGTWVEVNTEQGQVAAAAAPTFTLGSRPKAMAATTMTAKSGRRGWRAVVSSRWSRLRRTRKALPEMCCTCSRWRGRVDPELLHRVIPPLNYLTEGVIARRRLLQSPDTLSSRNHSASGHQHPSSAAHASSRSVTPGRARLTSSGYFVD